MRSNLSRGLGARYSPQVQGHRRRTAPRPAAPAPSLQATSPRSIFFFQFTVYIKIQKVLFSKSPSNVCPRYFHLPPSPAETTLHSVSKRPVACPLSCCYLPVMSTSTPPPLCDISNDPNSKQPKTNPGLRFLHSFFADFG